MFTVRTERKARLCLHVTYLEGVIPDRGDTARHFLFPISPASSFLTLTKAAALPTRSIYRGNTWVTKSHKDRNGRRVKWKQDCESDSCAMAYASESVCVFMCVCVCVCFCLWVYKVLDLCHWGTENGFVTCSTCTW